MQNNISVAQLESSPMGTDLQGLSHRREQIVKEKYSPHPFENKINAGNIRKVLESYLSMSQAFPYLQAGAQGALAFHCMDNNSDATLDMELTSVVGNFLCWDETGGHWIVGSGGISALPKILQTRKHFHSNLLRKDLEVLFGEAVGPWYSPKTRIYLRALHEGLASLDPVTRCATMVAFEAHAEIMIGALWRSVAGLFDVEKSQLTYFQAHVGGDDPAEAYHVEMTAKMISAIVSPSDSERFLMAFENAYALNYNWCEQICQEEWIGECH